MFFSAFSLRYANVLVIGEIINYFPKQINSLLQCFIILKLVDI